ncbi:unnamed protein product [Nesidiocoris tenuis]|uniref:Uncharacterized protein n=1 Tax=Nesidiocoris tenuis TaxID=355587 RepID=A0A6H5GED6_9HEMI|nr:unnamed protein product [Nesidiocoris tenuis]
MKYPWILFRCLLPYLQIMEASCIVCVSVCPCVCKHLRIPDQIDIRRCVDQIDIRRCIDRARKETAPLWILVTRFDASNSYVVRHSFCAVTTNAEMKNSSEESSRKVAWQNSSMENEGCRTLSTQHPGPGSVSVPQYETIDPYALTEDDLKIVHHDIRQGSDAIL